MMPGLKEIIGGVTNLADELVTTKEEERKIQLEEKKLDQELMLGQIQTNQQEAKHKSIFVAGWRPFIGWVGGSALAYKYILNPFLNWILIIAGTKVPELPSVDITELYPVILAMLGVAGMRTYEKKSGVSSDFIKPKKERKRRGLFRRRKSD